MAKNHELSPLHFYCSCLEKNWHHLISTNAELRSMLKRHKQADASKLHTFALAHNASAVHHHK